MTVIRPLIRQNCSRTELEVAAQPRHGATWEADPLGDQTLRSANRGAAPRAKFVSNSDLTCASENEGADCLSSFGVSSSSRKSTVVTAL